MLNFVFLLFFTVGLHAITLRPKVQTIYHTYNRDTFNGYSFKWYKLTDGQRRFEEASIEDGSMVVRGRYKPKVQTIYNTYNRDTFNGYSFKYKLTDGQSRFEESSIEDGSMVVRGRYSYKDGNGIIHTVIYVADKNGYRPREV